MRDADEHQQFVDGKRQRRMAEIDSQPPAIRELVHEYGWPVVKTCMDLGINQPRHIRHLVETVLNEFSPTRGSFAAQGIRPPLLSPPKTNAG
jgi:hypothetical protein